MTNLTTEEQQILHLVKTDTDQAKYFWSKVKSIKWFSILEKEGFFDPKHIQLDDNGNALPWNVLAYLERVSEQVDQNLEYGKKLIDIIESIVQSSINNDKINNYNIWEYCTKILNNLPPKVILDNLDDKKFHKWLITLRDSLKSINISIKEVSEILLPTFLQNDYGPEYKLAEVIIDFITQITTGEKPAGLDKREETAFKWNPYWIEKSLRDHSELIGEKCSIKCILGIADKLKRTLEYNQNNFSTYPEIDNDTYKIQVYRVEENGNEDGEINYKQDKYICSVFKYSAEQIKKNDPWTISEVKPEIKIKKPFLISASDSESFDTAIKKKLPKKINWKKDEYYQSRLKNLFKHINSDNSDFWFKSLTFIDHNYSNNTEKVLIKVLHDVFLEKCEQNPTDGQHIIDMFLSNNFKFPIFNRLALLCIDRFWQDYSLFFDKIINNYSNILEQSDLEVEMYDILYHHNADFNSELLEKLEAFIIDGAGSYIEDDVDYSYYWKYKWFSPLKDNNFFSESYERILKNPELNDKKPYKPERSSFKTGTFINKSPISKEKILEMPIEEIVKDLNEFKEVESYRERKDKDLPDKEGLVNVLASAIIENPKKFTDKIDDFMNVDSYYIHKLILSLQESWNNKKEIDWNSIFNFGYKFFDKYKEKIKEEVETDDNSYYRWTINAFVDLISDRSKNDDRVFDPKHFNEVEKIFNLIILLLKIKKNQNIEKDSMMYAINTTLGRVIMSYVAFSLRIARATKEKTNNWGNDNFERFFSKGIEANILFGRYLPQMKFLDDEYTKSKIIFFEKKDHNTVEWKMFMEGYLTGAEIYKDLFDLMYKNYMKGIKNNFFSDNSDRKLVQHISISYLGSNELLKEKNKNDSDNLFWYMLMNAEKTGTQERWLKAASFFWSEARKIKDNNKDSEKDYSKKILLKIIDFWRWSFNNSEKIKEILKDKYNSFLSQLVLFTIILDKINEESERWLLQSAPYIDIHHNSSFFLEYLAKFEDEESIKRIGNIYKKILESTTPSYKEEDIILIVRKQYQKGNKEDADSICNTYGRRGYSFLRPIWEEFNKDN